MELLLKGAFVGLTAGAMAGLLGIGGGIVMVPLMIWLFDYTQGQAQGMSLTVMIPPIGIFAAWQYWKHQEVNIPLALLIALGFIIGSYVSAGYAQKIDQQTLRRIFGLLVAYVAGQMLLGGNGGSLGQRLLSMVGWGTAGAGMLVLGGAMSSRRAKGTKEAPAGTDARNSSPDDADDERRPDDAQHDAPTSP
jgi:uncharacterized membrane protein YfcA